MTDIENTSTFTKAREFLELNEKRTQGTWHRDKSQWMKPEYDSRNYCKQGNHDVHLPFNGNAHNDCDFIAASPQAAQTIASLLEANKVLFDGLEMMVDSRNKDIRPKGVEYNSAYANAAQQSIDQALLLLEDKKNER